MERSIFREDFISAKGKGKYPVLLAYPVLAGGVKVWCPFCQEWHHHGALNGHRVAHCSEESSPFIQTGYILRLVNEKGKRLPKVEHNGSDIA